MYLRNSQYNTIMRRYDLLRARSRRRQQLCYEEVIARIPDYGAMEEELSSLCASAARQAVYGNTQTADFRARALALEKAMKQKLVEAGFPEDYLEMKYNCPDCRDTGFIEGEKCHCFSQAVVDLLYSQSGLGEVLQKENFATFRKDLYPTQPDPVLGISPREQIESVLASCHRFIREFDTHHGNLLFYGNTGVGKTFLTHCITKELLDTSHTAIYLSALSLFEILEDKTFRKEASDAGDDMADYIYSCDLMVIDDLGSELSNAFVNSQLFDFLNRRLSENVSTIISTNLSLEELQDTYSERIISRLIGHYEMLPVIGDDIRVKLAISGI